MGMEREAALRAKGFQGEQPREQFSTPGTIVGGVASIPFEIAGGMGAQHGLERGLEIESRGGTRAEAMRGAAVTGAVRGALNLLPVKAGGAVGKAVEGKVGSVVGGAATGGGIAAGGGIVGRALEDAALPEGKQFEDLKQPNDMNTIALDAAMGAAFGGGSGAMSARTTRKKTKAAAEAKANEFPADKFEDMGDGNYRAPNGAIVTKDMWDSNSPKVREGWMEEAPKPPGEPKLQEEIERLREEHPTGPVATVVNEVTKQREKVAKTKSDAAELRKAAEQTTDAELKKALNARAEKIDPSEKIPVGEVKQGQPKIEAEAPKKIPEGEVKEGQPEIKTEKAEPIPKGEVIEEKIPVGETDEVPDVGGKIPVGEAKEITRSGVEPTDEPKPGSIPKGETKELYIPPEKRNAADQVPKQESLQSKRVEGDESGQAPEAGGGDRVLDTTSKPGTEAVARDWGTTSAEAAQKIRDLKTKGDITAIDEAKMLSIADKHKSDPNLRTTKLNNFMTDRGQPIPPRTTKKPAGPDPAEAPEIPGKGKSADIDDDIAFDPNDPKSLTFPKIEASMIDASQRETERKAVYKSTPRADDGLRIVGKDDRGITQVRTALKEGMRDGSVDKDGGELALWALERNPNLARGLKLRSTKDEGPGRGMYNNATRIIDLFKHNDRKTGAHEILHHSERMMPEIVQTGIRREWKRALSKAVAEAKTPVERQALKDIQASAFRGDANARKRVMDAMIGDENNPAVIDKYKFYHLMNPSEFWAVNAANIMHERHIARGSWRSQAKRWLKELVEKAKGIVGIRSEAPLLKALDELLDPKKVRGERSGARALSEGGGRAPVKVPRDFQDPDDGLKKFSKNLGDRVKAEVEYMKLRSRQHEWAYNVGDVFLSTKTGKTYKITGRTFMPHGPIKNKDYQPTYFYEGGNSKGTMREKALRESTTMKNLTTPTMLDPNDPNISAARKQTETPEFKRWFGDSKVVDAQGKPLVVYHGSGKRFTEFSPDKQGAQTDQGYLGAGFYFGSRQHAGMYANMPMHHAKNAADDANWRGDPFIPIGQRSALYPVNLSIKKPLVLKERRDPDTPNRTLDREKHIRDALKLPRTASAKEVTAAAKRAGHDGVIFEYEKGDPDSPFGLDREFVAFEPTQVKSAIGNRGTFDPNDPNISLAVGPGKPMKRTLPEETDFQKVERALFDRFNRVTTLQKTEAPKKEGANIYLADQLFQGRAQHRGDVLERDFVKPLGKDLEAAKKLGLKVTDADDYLMALHAPERNRAIAAINPKMQDGGSGLTNKQAQKIIDGFSPEQRKALDAIAKRVHDMHRKKLNDMVDDGLITADARDALNRKFKNYVPLKTIDEEEAFTGIGQGYSMRATDIKEALGRSSKAGSPVAASMMDAARSIVRGEKARVDRSIWEYAQDKAAHDFIKPYDPNKPPPEVTKQAKGPDGQVKKVVDPNKVRDMTIDLVVDGQQQKIFVPDQLLRDQIRKLATVNDPGKVLGAIGKVTSGIGRMLTEFNPAFTLPNAVRDSITIGMRAKAHGLSPAKVVGGIPESWGEIISYKRGANTPGAKMYEEFLSAGAKTGAYGVTDVTQTMRRLERMGAQIGDKRYETNALRRKGGQVLRTAAQAMSGFNEIFEYAGRFSAFKEARAAGKSVKESAAIAKEISVNFNRSGEHTRWMNSLFVFANAALQGLRNSAVYAAKSKAVRHAMLGTVGVGAMAQMWNELMGGINEDTGEPKANMQNDAMADKNLMLMWPGSDKGIKIPLPPEYSWLYAMGRRGYRAFSQGHSKKEAAGIAGNLLDAVLPVRLPDTDSHVGAAAKALVFTPVVPFADLLGDNKNFFGQDIVPDRHDDISPAPYVKSSRTTTSDIAKGISEGMNTITGGDKIRPGLSEKALGPLVSPEGIEHITGFYTGGIGQLVMQSKNLAKAASKGDPVDINKIPIANRFLFEEPKSYTSRRYKELRPEFEYAKDYIKADQENKVDPKVRRALDEFVGAEKELRVLFKQLKTAASENNDAEKKEIEQNIKRAQSRVIRSYYGQPQQ
jgi:hypothetical protein